MNADAEHELYAKLAGYSREAVLHVSGAMPACG